MKVMANQGCKECGCKCSICCSDHDIHLHAEIEQLKERIAEKDNQIVTMETNFLNEATKFPSGELLALHEELLTWQDKYRRLHESHRRVQRVNQGLEDKLLRLVDVSETDKITLTKDVATLAHQLADANYTIKKLRDDNERYKNDVLLAVQFLQCKPANFVSQRVDSLPNEVQAKVSTYIGGRRKDAAPPRSIKVPIPTFPPTAMVYSVPKVPSLHSSVETPSVDIVSAAIMAKVLQERERERSFVKHCDTCTCSTPNEQIKVMHEMKNVETQTLEAAEATNESCSVNSKTIPVYIHDFHAVQMAKVQPNNFLQSQTEEKCRSMQLESENLIDLEETGQVAGQNVETIYFANERAQRAGKSVSNYCKMAPLHKTLSVSSADASSLSLASGTCPDWMDGQSSSCASDSIDASKYKEMEDHVKKFLFGEYTILGDVNENA